MPKGVPTVASFKLKKGQKIGAWYFQGFELKLDPWTRPDGTVLLPYSRPEGKWPGPVELRISLGRGAGPRRPSGGPEHPDEWLQLRVRWTGVDAPHPSSVKLDGSEWGNVEIGPTFLKRFPWKVWLTVADAARYAAFHAETPGVFEVIHEPGGSSGTNLLRRVNRRAKSPAKKRPGRAGHDDAHYKRVAQRYEELRLGGSTSPTLDIAGEYTVGRSTAAGWVRRAREKGFLAPGRRGRPGGINTS